MIGLAADPYAPDGDEARRWAEQELQNPRYADAKPTWFDHLAEDVAEFIIGLFSPDAGERAGSTALVIVTVVIVAALITVLILWGRPRPSRRRPRRDSDLLGERDDRSAAQLRAEAERRARDGDWDTAIVLRFRAMARALLERDIIDPAPGATAQAIAREAAETLTAHHAELAAAAGAFDRVRYLRHPASESTYRELVATDDLISSARPAVPA
ncbi:hypothetical protein HD600_002261 [Microbacterium ginsengiterrae]|uniref:Protein-glutamine gamma-glutamyltransferase-like C-terminal domain-containing protein n=1 Tax=Microbacterium ginsengiterrae TaxID=546115 RepID=A0A7W9CE00_9MICO|nr:MULTISPECIES: DUF4129 domain-containing protein [Microbacterium]MBB5743764.1 hypothetical protein [Microbacterium ginsengiterrae]